VNEVVGAFLPHAIGGHGFARIQVLPGVVHNAAPDEVDDAVPEHFGVDTEAPPVIEIGKDGIGDIAVPHLNGVAVFDETGNMLTDAVDYFPIGVSFELEDRLIVGEDEVYILDVNEAVPMHARHLRVDLGYDSGGCLNGRFDNVHADTKAKVAVRVRQRCLDKSDIDRNGTRMEEVGNLRKEDGRVVGDALVDGIATVASHKERVMSKIMLELLVGIGRITKSPDMDYLGIEEGFWMGFDVIDECADKVLGFTASRADEYTVAFVDMGEYILVGAKFLGVGGPEFVQTRQVVYSGHEKSPLPAPFANSR
jgi:hypothetical protein